jgi:aldose 1-epimerase
MEPAANYTARRTVEDGFDVLVLADAARRTEVSIAPGVGNNATAYTVDGRNYLWAPFTLRELAAKATFCGNPLMAPWANRLDRFGFHANGRYYGFNPGLGNILKDEGGLPLHGLLINSPRWTVEGLAADAGSASAACRLEFWRHPELMAQFPFAHTIEVTHRLREGVLEVETRLENHASEPMPVSLGYHPFFRLHDAPRAGWKVHLPAREEMPLSAAYFPTGGMRPLRLPDPVALAGMEPVYTLPVLERGPDGCAVSWVQGAAERLTVTQGPKYPVCVVYAPAGQDYICFEPMTATINAMNPAPDGRPNPVQTVAPGSEWKESFWIRHTPRPPNPKD